MLTPLEHAEQVAVVAWFRENYPETLIYAIPNGGARSAITGAALKAEGVVAGMPDLHIPAWRVWLEMKRRKNGRVSPAQAAIHTHLRGIGDAVIIALGAAEAMRLLRKAAPPQPKQP
jgi:hypothetical protein